MDIETYLDELYEAIFRKIDKDKCISYNYVMKELEINIFKNALRQANFVKKRAAILLGYKRPNFSAKLNAVGLGNFCEEHLGKQKKERKDFIVQIIVSALTACRFNISQTARYLGVRRDALDTQIERNKLGAFVRKNKKLLQYGKLAEL